jgi:hypothetical protein
LLRTERAEVSKATVAAAGKAPEIAEAVETAAVDGLGNAAQSAESVTKKVNDYLLNPAHPDGGPKAKWFQQALGFTRGNAGQLAEQIVSTSPRRLKPSSRSAESSTIRQSPLLTRMARVSMCRSLGFAITMEVPDWSRRFHKVGNNVS